MAINGEGTIYIPLEELWNLAAQYGHLDKTLEVAYGVPRVVDGDLVIDVAFSTESHPTDWAKPPAAVTQWKEVRK